MPYIVANASQKPTLKSILKSFKTITKSREDFLRLQLQKSLSEKILVLLKKSYDVNVLTDTKISSNEIPLSLEQGLDEEQIWQLIEIRNNILRHQLLQKTAKMLVIPKQKLKFTYKCDENTNSDSSVDGFDGNDSSEENYGSGDEEEKIQDFTKNKKSRSNNNYSSVVDDQFFKLSEMEAFLNAEDKKEILKQNKRAPCDGDIDYFREIVSDDDTNFNEFFKDDQNNSEESINKESKSDMNYSSNEENDDISEQKEKESDSFISSEKHNADNKIESSFQKRREQFDRNIKDYEEKNLSEKPWHMKGEIEANHRPQNSLLEEVLEFEATNRPTPIITQETTLRLEDIIRHRIKDQVWDDVELKVKSIKTPQGLRKELILNQEKSKESLAQIYENKYRTEIENKDSNDTTGNKEEPQQHKEIKEMMKSLFVKLDALSGFHFTPKPVAPEPKIITNTTVANMEEVASLAVSNSKLLAPEEIRNQSKGTVLGSSERSRGDKNRERRQKKQKQKSIYKNLEKKKIQNAIVGNKSIKGDQDKLVKNLTKNRNVDKVSLSKDVSALKSSKKFFSKLQDSTLTKQSSTKQKKGDLTVPSAKRFKL